MNKLYVVSEENSEVEIFDSIKLSFRRRWNLKELTHPEDIVSCSSIKCIYIFNSCRYQIAEILKVNLDGKLLKKWLTGCNSGCGLSVTGESNINF